jgi:predicted nucleic acid-binding protein
VILYIDTSALVKLYAKEAGTTEVQRAVAKAEQIATSLIAYVETRSALARKYRLKQVDGAALQRHKREFERDWAQL